ncbi:MAG: hypothetical protein ACREKH_01170, partial [Candidatus Rokuibacteriota bacterium]
MSLRPARRRDTGFWIGTGVVVLVVAALRVRLLSVPFERDEGEFAYAGQMLLKGFLPYEHVYNMKLPGIYAAYAAILGLFGQSIEAVHFGLLLINAATAVIVGVIARGLVGSLGGVAAAAIFGAHALLPTVQGIFAQSEHFVIFAAMGGLLLLWAGLEGQRPWMLGLGGLLLGVGVLMKQHGAPFAVLGVAFVAADAVLRERPGLLRRTLLVASCAALPYLLTVSIYLARGSFETFWYWTFTYARVYAAQVGPEEGWQNLQTTLVPIYLGAPALWWLAALGVASLGWRSRRMRWIVGGLTASSILAVLPGFYFRPHYFVLLLPCAAVLGALGIASIDDFGRRLARRPVVGRAAAIACLLASIAHTLDVHGEYLFRATPLQAVRMTYGPNPFPEAVKVGEYLAVHSDPEDRIEILGSEPQILFYADRMGATGYIYAYPLTETHELALEMQRRRIADIEAAKPKFIVHVVFPWSWGLNPESSRLLNEWLPRYLREHYRPVALVQTFPFRRRGEEDHHHVEYDWGEDGEVGPLNPNWDRFP